MNFRIVHVSASAKRAHCSANGRSNGTSRPPAGAHFLAVHVGIIEAEKEIIVDHDERGAVVVRQGRRFDNEFPHDDNGFRRAPQPMCPPL